MASMGLAYLDNISHKFIGFMVMNPMVEAVKNHQQKQTKEYAGWFIGILIMAYDNPHITG